MLVRTDLADCHLAFGRYPVIFRHSSLASEDFGGVQHLHLQPFRAADRGENKRFPSIRNHQLLLAPYDQMPDPSISF
jgi:hypothetical protein